MDKPVTVVREELRTEIISAINQSNLPAFVVADMLRSFLEECKLLEKQQYENDLKIYNDSLNAKEVEE